MTTAELVNLIFSKLRTGRVVFYNLDGAVVFSYGGNTYEAFSAGETIQVIRPASHGRPSTTDSYSQWIEGVLNSKTRTDSGELV